NIVEHYYGDYDVKHTDEAVITIFAQIFGDGGKPVIPVAGTEWPRYTVENPQLLRLQPN
ncbi:hypothetical protein IscW_ISCW022254, partial [Ixodes scapularis]